LRLVIVRDLAIEELFKRVTADVIVNDADVRDFDNKNLDAFTRPETASVRQIWIAARKDATPADHAKAKARKRAFLSSEVEWHLAQDYGCSKKSKKCLKIVELGYI
jgi:hypothetical protein